MICNLFMLFGCLAVALGIVGHATEHEGWIFAALGWGFALYYNFIGRYPAKTPAVRTCRKCGIWTREPSRLCLRCLWLDS